MADKKHKTFNFGDKEAYEKIYTLEAQQLAKISYGKRLKVILNRPLEELRGTSLHRVIMEAFEGQVIDEKMTIDEARITQLLSQMFKGGANGLKAIELSYKIDGTFDNKEVDVDLDEIDTALEGIE